MDFDSASLFTLDAARLTALAKERQADYARNAPFPHIVIDDFLPAAIAQRLVDEFPLPESPVFFDRNSDMQPGKLGTVDGRRLTLAPPFIQHALLTLNSYTLLYFLQNLTGIQALLTDPYFLGGGLHQIKNGGFLNIHADFNFEPRIMLYRRINLLLYLNKDWDDAYGGHLELWNNSMTACVKKIAPVFNRCVIFNTGRYSYHGHPQPVNVPDDITRKSIAIYYYTKDPLQGEETKHSTLWQTAT